MHVLVLKHLLTSILKKDKRHFAAEEQTNTVRYPVTKRLNLIHLHYEFWLNQDQIYLNIMLSKNTDKSTVTIISPNPNIPFLKK